MLYLQFRNLLLSEARLGPHDEVRIGAGQLCADGRVAARLRAPYWEIETATYTGYVCSQPLVVCLEAANGERSPCARVPHHAMAGTTAYAADRAFARYDADAGHWRDASGREWVALLLTAPRERAPC